MKPTLFIKQLSEYFDVYLPSNKRCSNNTIASYADGFVTLFQFFEDEKGKNHYSIKYSDITAKTMDECILWLQNQKNYSAASQYVTTAKADNPNLFNEESYSPHSFRHSKAVHMLEAGVPLIYIRNFLGHESIQTTEISENTSEFCFRKY